MRKLVAVAVATGVLIAGTAFAEESRERVHGDPSTAATWALEQRAKGLCGPTAAAIVAGLVAGHRLGQSEPRWTAERLGLMDYELGGGVTGMRRASLPRLLAQWGIGAAQDRTTVNGLRMRLDEGRGIILHLDADELWFGADLPADGPDGGADHFVVLVAIDDATQTAILHDPGRAPVYGFPGGSGAGFTVSFSDLDDAWEDSGRRLVVTEGPASISAA